QPPPRLQGAAQRSRAALTGFEGRVPLRFRRARARALRRGRRRPTRQPRNVPRVRCADTRRGLRVLPPARAGADRGVSAAMSRPLAPGERVLLVDSKQRRHLVTLAEGGEFHSHAGVLRHDDIIGNDEGIAVRTTLGARLLVVRPTLAEYVLEMPRGAQVIYPKDLGPILLLADIFPGARVFESGIGSGALTMTLLRAVGPAGSVVGYELRDDFAA